MATTSTLATAWDALKTLMDTGILAGNVFTTWPGPLADGKNEVVWIHEVTDWTQEIAGIKAGRKQRQEDYVFKVVLWCAKPEASADGGGTTRDRALTMAAVIESALAETVQMGTTAIQFAALEEREFDLFPWEKGWACQIVLYVHGHARLT